MPSLELATPEFLDTAPFRVIFDVTVDAPISTCWDLIADQSAWVQWFDDMSSVEATPWLWTEAGQTRTVVVNNLKVEEQAISIIPQQEYAFSIVKWPLPIATKAAEGIRLKDRSDEKTARTQLTYIGAFDLHRLARLAEGRMTKQFTAAWTPAFIRLGELAAAKGMSHG